MSSRRRKKTAETTRSHLILLASVSILTMLVVLLGRTPVEQQPGRRAPARSLELRRGFSLSIGDQSPAPNPVVTVAPIPLPPGELDKARLPNDFVPLTPSLVQPLEMPPSISGIVVPPDIDEGTRQRADSRNTGEFPGGDVCEVRYGDVTELRWHRIVEGESLELIAKRYYGQDQMAAKIFEMNRDILSQPDLLPLGAHLRLPAGND